VAKLDIIGKRWARLKFILEKTIMNEREYMDELMTKLTNAMKETFGSDEKRIGHALSVLKHALTISGSEGGDMAVVIASALLHDIGIHEAERKHGSSAGKYQEIEGPPIARKIMENLGLEQSVIDHVCRIVGSHHSARDIDTLEFRIIWDADWLVNIPDEFDLTDRNVLKERIDKIFKTETGKREAERIYLKVMD
jgi:hypothetical protein